MQDHFYLFVYGTLKRGGRAVDLLRDCVYVRDATVIGTLYDVNGDYPALVLGGAGNASGEVWRCPVRLLRALDEYEGTRHGFFRRVALRVGAQSCWTYVAGPQLAARLTPARRIDSGVWDNSYPALG